MELVQGLVDDSAASDTDPLPEVAELLVALSDRLASGDPDQLATLNDVSVLFLTAYGRFGVPGLLDYAVVAGLGAVARLPEPEDRHMMAICASNYANALGTRYEAAGQLSDLDTAVQAARAGVQVTDDDHPHRGQHFNVLGKSLLSAYNHTRQPALLDEALAAFRESIACTSPDSVLWAATQANVCAALRTRFLLVRDKDVLAEAIRAARAAAGSTVLDGDDRLMALNNLGTALLSWFGETQDVAALDEAARTLREALSHIPDGHRHQAMFLSNLGLVLARAEQPAAAVRYAAAAVDHTPAGHPDRSRYLSNLGLVLRASFEASHDMATLRAAVRATRDAIPADGPRRAERLERAGTAVAFLAKYTHDVADLAEAESLHREAVANTPRDDVAFPERVNELATVLHARAARDPDPAISAEAEECFRTAVSATPADDRRRAGYLNNLGIALRARYEHDADDAALRESIELCRAAVAATPANDAGAAMRLCMLGVGLLRHHESIGMPDVLAEAVGVLRRAGAAVGPRDRVVVLANLSAVLRASFVMTGDPAELAEAIDAGRAAVAAQRDGDPEAFLGQHNLGAALQEAYRRHGDRAQLDEAIHLYRTAARPVHAGQRAMALSNLGFALRSRFQATGDRATLDEALDAGRRALDEARPGDASRGMYLLNLGGTLLVTYEITGDPETMAEALRVTEAAVDAQAPGAVLRTVALGNVGALHRMRYELTGDPAALDEAVRLGRIAVDALPAGHQMRPTVEHQLSRALAHAHGRTGDVDPLRAAAHHLRRLVTELPQRDPDMCAARTDLGLVLRQLAERTGEELLLDEAVRHCRAAVACAPEAGIYLLNARAHLGSALASSAERTGERAPLDEAVAILRDVLDGDIATEPRTRSVWLAHLGRALILRWTRTGELDVLGEAVRTFRAAVDAVPADYFQRRHYLATLAVALDNWSTAAGEPDALDEALAAHREALAACPADNPLRAQYLGNLGLNLLRRAPDASDEAVASLRDAVDHFRSDDPGRIQYQVILGRALLARAKDDAVPPDEARAVLAAAVHESAAPILIQLAAGGSLAEAELAAGAPDAALDAVERVVELLPRFASRAWSRADRENRLGRLAGVAAETAAVAVAAGRPERAVELLEQTRGLLLGEAIDDRSDTTHLRRAAPELAVELDELRARNAMLERAEPDIGTPVESRDDEPWRRAGLGEQRRQLAARWTELLGRIRDTPGCADFLRPPDIARLSRQAVDGPIVLLYAGETNAGALILTGRPAQPVHVVALPELTEASAAEQVTKLRAAIEADEHGEDDVYAVLGWLWDHVTHPVLTALDLTDVDGDPPRIWWCPVGSLALLPIHAAGRHREPGRHTVLDRTVSSYTSTVRALEYARTRTAAPAASAVLVTMPTTPDAAPLPASTREAVTLVELFADLSVLSGADATHHAVADALTRYPIAHIVCHAVSDQAAPGASHLMLHDHVTHPLTVTALTRLHLGRAELAYLSACRTTETTPALADEAVHLTGAVQLAGYRHVIGTLWPVRDPVAARAAARFYALLGDVHSRSLDTARSAAALAEVVRTLRDRYPKAPSQWAGYLHHGI